MFFKSQFFATIQEIPKDTNLNGKVAIVTGASSGLGLEASRQLLSFGLSCLILAVRSTEKGEIVASKFRTDYPGATVHVWCLDMESYDSIQKFVHRVGLLSRLDIAILNAAMQALEFGIVSSTRHEQEIQVNYLSTMLLAILLLPILKAKSPPGVPGRLSIVSSGTVRGAKIVEPKDAPVLAGLDNKSQKWNPIERYAVSKLLGHLFMMNLVKYVSADDVIVNLVDPGLVRGTALQRALPFPFTVLFSCFKAVMGRAMYAGASTYLDAVIVKDKESHGSYVADWKIAQ